MSRRLVPLAVLAAAVVGCAQQQATPSGGGDVAAPGPTGDPTASYTIKLREKQAGEKYEVTETRSSTTTTTFELPGGKQTKTDNADARLEYTEAVLEMPAGAAQPTKLTRVYKVAEWTPPATKGKAPAPPGKVVPASFVGKTVAVEKKGEAYTFKADGKDLPASEAKQFADEFGAARVRPQDLLPKAPVRLNDVWNTAPEAMKAMAASLPKESPVNADKSKMTGKLTRVYTKDGRQFGVIEVRTELTVEGKGSAGPTGTLTYETTYDVPIDGSSHEGTMKVNMTGTLNTRQKGVEIQAVVDAKQERVVKPAK
jgi:hypothetical protein